MATKKKITGVVSYQDIGPGFWGITDKDGNDWRPVMMPDQLKYKGKKVSCVVREIEDEVSIYMWGTPVEVLSFETV